MGRGQITPPRSASYRWYVLFRRFHFTTWCDCH